MPQLDISTWSAQIFWLAIIFVALYIVMSRVVIPRTGGAIEKRKSTVEGDLAAAQKLKGETDAAIAAYESALAEARAKATTIATENRARLTAQIDGERAKLDASLAAKIGAAEKQIAAAKQKALDEVQGVAADIAANIVHELTGTSVGAAEAASAVAKVAK